MIFISFLYECRINFDGDFILPHIVFQDRHERVSLNKIVYKQIFFCFGVSHSKSIFYAKSFGSTEYRTVKYCYKGKVSVYPNWPGLNHYLR